MRALFVHGMGRSTLSGRALLKRLRDDGVDTETFGYMVSLESFESICRRLQHRIAALASRGEYILIGHSLGGVLIRAALQAAPPVTPPLRVFLLGSPFKPSRIARRLRANLLYRLLAGDCGQLLASRQRMASIGTPMARLTGIVGTRGRWLTRGLFGVAANDGVVAVDEVTHDVLDDAVQVDVLHTWLPSSARVADILLSRLDKECASTAQARPGHESEDRPG